MVEARKIQHVVNTEPNWDEYKSEDQENIKNLIEEITAETYSIRQTASKIILTFHGLKNITYDKLRYIEVQSDRIFNIEIDLKKCTLKIYKWKTSKKPTQKSLNAINQTSIINMTNKWIKTQENVKAEDAKLVKRVVETIVTWTWNKQACLVNVTCVGDSYEFVVQKLSNISLAAH